MNTTIQLMNGEEFAARYPDTFQMPPLRERQTLQPGDQVKLAFIGDPVGERMWVLVARRTPEGHYYGTLRCAPLFVTCIDLGDEVYFEPRHVIDIDRGFDDPAEQGVA